MTSDRAQAYGRVVKAVDSLSDSKLHPGEQAVLKEAADALLFCDDLARDPAARESLAAADEVLAHLVEADRVIDETAARLRRDLEACGPVAAVGG